MRKSEERAWLTAAALAAAPAFLLPIGDPDLWWHLSAGRWMLEHLAWPGTETLSYTRAGVPWVDFEWLSQLAFSGVHAATGLAGLWVLKVLLLAAAGAGVHSLAARTRIAVPYRALALALWAVAVIPRADIRTELFSMAAFAWLLRFLEEVRERGASGDRTARSPTALCVGGFVFFALWANLHAAFAYGLLLLGLYAAGETLEGRGRTLWACFGAGAAGTLVNPYGLRLHAVLWSHFREAGGLRDYILEWGPLSLGRMGHWPTWLLMLGAVCLALWAYRARACRIPVVHVAALGVFGVAAFRHARVGAFFCTLAVPYLLELAARAGAAGKACAADQAARRARWAGAAGLAACAAFGLWIGQETGVFRKVFHDLFIPVRAAVYLERSPELGRLRLYHPWGWGGFLGYRSPTRKIFQDGRYVFHSLLREAGEAIRSPEAWEEFLAHHGVEAVLLENVPLMLDTTRRYPDGTERPMRRPYYLRYMPRERWALVYFDDRALLFVRRGALAAGRLAALEYRLARPRDDEALGDALRRGEIDEELLETERARHRAELKSLPASL
ncbi:MAG: hypothetical protein ABII00_08440 [Elusimicrobiota bacterium]